MLIRTLTYFEEQPRGRVFLVVPVLIGLLGFIDYLTGFELSFAVFYLIPVALVSWTHGKRIGLIASALCAVVWLAANVLAGATFSLPAIGYWNGLTRYLIYALFADLLAELRGMMDDERRLARRDPLTGILNRRSFLERLEAELDRTQRTRQPVSLLVLDLDNFKQLNDEHGHSAGDALLVEFSGTILREIRSIDAVGRMGGDEFAVILRGTDVEGAQEAGLRIQRTMRELLAGAESAVSVSIGGVSCTDTDTSGADLLEAADRLLYRVKRSSKDEILVDRFPGDPNSL